MNEYAPCPRCRASNAEKVRFTWWGGIIGPKILTHVKCPSCGEKYNGKTGNQNTTGIVIYMFVVGIICFVVIFVMFALLAIMKH